MSKLLQNAEYEWREKNGVPKLVAQAFDHITKFGKNYHLTDLAVAKSYIDELYCLYMRKENENVKA